MSGSGPALYASAFVVRVGGTVVAELKEEALEQIVREYEGSSFRLRLAEDGLVQLVPVSEEVVKKTPNSAKNGKAKQQVLTVAAWCEEIGVSRSLAYREMRLGNLPYLKFAGRKLIDRSAAYAWAKREAERAAGKDLM